MKVNVVQGQPIQPDDGDENLANFDLGTNPVDPNNRTGSGPYATPGQRITGQYSIFGDRLGTASPVMAVIQKPGEEPKMYYRSAVGVGYSSTIKDLEELQAEGFEVKSIVSGTHANNNQAQNFNALAMHDYATQLGVDFGLIDFQDQGQGAWWVHAQRIVSDDVTVWIGNG